MNSALSGARIGAHSTRPNYVAGREWLHFSADGRHCYEALHPGQDLREVRIPFRLREQSGRTWVEPSCRLPNGSATIESAVAIASEISVTTLSPRDGAPTFYHRVKNDSIKPRPAA